LQAFGLLIDDVRNNDPIILPAQAMAQSCQGKDDDLARPLRAESPRQA